jgi:hypothetical protein
MNHQQQRDSVRGVGPLTRLSVIGRSLAQSRPDNVYILIGGGMVPEGIGRCQKMQLSEIDRFIRRSTETLNSRVRKGRYSRAFQGHDDSKIHGESASPSAVLDGCEHLLLNRERTS